MKVVRPFFLLATIAIFVYICGIGIKNIIRYNSFKLHYTTLIADLRKETHINESFKNQLLAMNETGYWELKAKEQLGYVKPGETVYKLISSTP